MWVYGRPSAIYIYIYIYIERERESVFPIGPGDLGSIPGCVIPETFKMLLDTSLLNTRQYNMCIEVKEEQSRERSSASPTPQRCSYWKGSLLVTLDYSRQFHIYIYIYIYIYEIISRGGFCCMDRLRSFGKDLILFFITVILHCLLPMRIFGKFYVYCKNCVCNLYWCLLLDSVFFCIFASYLMTFFKTIIIVEK